MNYPPNLILIGRGVINPSQPGYGGKPARVARLEPGSEGLGPLFAASPRLAYILGDICIAANMGDSAALACAIHRAESALDALGWDWGNAAPIINPDRRI